MAGKGKNTVKLVSEAIAPVAEQLGLILWDVLFLKEGPSWFLRIFIDREGGVSLDDCERMSRAIDPLIDELDPCEQEYYLEVSSPGLGRVLRSDEHLAQYVGEPVRLRFYRPNAEGLKEITGLLGGYDKATVSLRLADENREIIRSEISEIRVDDDQDI